MKRDRIVQIQACVVAFDTRAVRAGERTDDYVRSSRVDVVALTESGAVWQFWSNDHEWRRLPPLPIDEAEEE